MRIGDDRVGDVSIIVVIFLEFCNTNLNYQKPAKYKISSLMNRYT
jgi:hypothetical protein